MRRTDRISETARDGTCSFGPCAVETGEPAIKAKSISAECKGASAVVLCVTHAPRVPIAASRANNLSVIFKSQDRVARLEKSEMAKVPSPARETDGLRRIDGPARVDRATLICKRDNSSYALVHRVKVRTWKWLFPQGEIV